MLGGWKFAPPGWSNPAKRVQELEDLGARLMVMSWPAVNVSGANNQKMRPLGFQACSEQGSQVSPW